MEIKIKNWSTSTSFHVFQKANEHGRPTPRASHSQQPIIEKTKTSPRKRRTESLPGSPLKAKKNLALSPTKRFLMYLGYCKVAKNTFQHHYFS